MQSTYSYKEIWKISWPLIVGGMAQAFINVTDSAFLGRVSEVAMGASAIAGLFFVALLMLGLGFGIGLQIVVARLDGEGKQNDISSTTHQALYFLIGLSLLMIGVCLFSGKLFLSWFVQSPDVLQACIEYLNIRSFGFFFVFILTAWRSFYTGIAETRVISYTTGIMACANFFLNYCFIFGHFGFPEMGIAGAALASSLSEAIACVFIIIYMFKDSSITQYRIFSFSQPDLKKFLSIFYIGAPVMIQMASAVTSWFIFFLIVEKIGERELAVSNVIRNVYMVLMVPLMGFGSATNTLVSNVVGQGKINEIIPLIRRIMLLSFLASLLVVVINAIYPYMTIRLFTNIDEVAQKSVPVTYVISGSLLLFSVSYMMLAGVSGTGRTLVTLGIELFTVLIYLVVTYFFAVKWKMSLEIVWSVEYVYFAMMGSLSLLYLKFGGWRK